MPRLKLATVGLLMLSLAAAPASRATRPATGPQQVSQDGSKDPAVQRVLDRYGSIRPDDNDLAIFQLDWVPTLADAREKAAREQRPILLMVVTNSYGNVYTGHC